MQTVTNFFITNLALSDILLCILAVPFTPLYTFVGNWVFGRVLCHLVAYAQGTSVYISTLTLTSIAIDRYFVIIYPFQPRMKQSTCLYIILFIWTFSLAVTLPYGLYMSFRDSLCEEAWPSESFRQIYSGVTTVLQFLVPLVVIAFCYICVSVRLSDHARLRPGCKSSRKEEADRERKRRTNRMLIAMVTVFGISWMPLNVINLLNDYHAKTGTWHYYNLVFFMVHALAMSSTCYNPFLYAWLNDNFRKEFKQVLPCFIRFGLSQPACSAGSAPTQTSVAPYRADHPAAACNGGHGGGAPPRTATARAEARAEARAAASHGPEAHDALLPAAAAPAPRGRRSDDWGSLQAQGNASGNTNSQNQLRGKRKDASASSPTTEAVSWTDGRANLGDLVTATYSTEDGSVEVHLPLEAVSTPSGASGATSPAAAAVAPPERPLINISPESSPLNRGSAAAAAARGMPAAPGSGTENGISGLAVQVQADGAGGHCPLRLLPAAQGLGGGLAQGSTTVA
ncbi:Prolactin-releasing peptide receptor [Frankliniella fusca]|uniref:Prolactin-releasing peptide receptor n=1 Tax=Frankliniella fusca TaxID=407009 RepID=A0AAE1HCA1_9NEOP|nr:Prolactin-releasing peptide receptor [Frankliniella fusca]